MHHNYWACAAMKKKKKKKKKKKNLSNNNILKREKCYTFKNQVWEAEPWEGAITYMSDYR